MIAPIIYSLATSVGYVFPLLIGTLLVTAALVHTAADGTLLIPAINVILKLGKLVLDAHRDELTLDQLTAEMAGGKELADLSHELRGADSTDEEDAALDEIDAGLARADIQVEEDGKA